MPANAPVDSKVFEEKLLLSEVMIYPPPKELVKVFLSTIFPSELTR